MTAPAAIMDTSPLPSFRRASLGFLTSTTVLAAAMVLMAAL